jgi:Flp pilus assembly CpaE family ATPase
VTPPDEQRLSLAPHLVVERCRKNGASVKASARVVLGLDEREVAEEVMHFLDRDGARVVGTAEDPRQLHAAVQQLEPDAVIASPRLVRSGPSVNGSVLLTLDTAESVRSLRASIDAGARGFYLWPGDRERLSESLATLAFTETSAAGAGRVVAVYSPRGGSGGTFVATHLAAAFARRDAECVLIDLDPLFGDVAAALGRANAEETRSIADVVPVANELTPQHLEDVLWRHPEGFRALLGPIDPATGDELDGAFFSSVVRVVRSSCEVAVLSAPRHLGGATRIALNEADRTLIVLSLDGFSFRDAQRALAVLEGDLDPDTIGFLVNRARRAEVTPKDVERVFERPPIAVIPFDRKAAEAQDRGRLLPRRSRLGRAFDGLAKDLVEVES